MPKARIAAVLVLTPSFGFTQASVKMPGVSADGFTLQGIEISRGSGGIARVLATSIVIPRSWDRAKGLKIVFALAGVEDGDTRCGVYEGLLTTRLEERPAIPLELLNPGGLCKPDRVQVFSIETAEERIKAAQEAARAQARAQREAADASKRSAEAAAYLAQLPRLFNGSEEIFVGSDRKCAQQFIEAQSMEGLEKRKRIADLVLYGCGFTVPAGTHVKVSMKNVSFIEISVAEGKYSWKSGWVPLGWVK